MSGGSSWHGPDILLDEDIILVTINYRLGPFGFMSLDTAEYSGNMGLKDTLLALKWVNENIEFFGGEPNVKVFPNSLSIQITYYENKNQTKPDSDFFRFRYSDIF